MAAVSLAPLQALAQPVCPVCTVAVCTGLGLARWLKIDDTITGLWLAGLIIAFVGWTVDFCRKKKWSFPGLTITAVLFFYLSAILPLYWLKIVGDPLHKLFGMDKLVLGIAIGSVFFVFSLWLHSWLKKRNNDKVFFPYQKVVIPVGVLLVLSLVVYFVVKWC